MLFAVEGGGFFSSSASGYSKGLTLLLLGQKNEEKPMRVTPWNQYQLVDQETDPDPDPDPDLQLASEKNHTVRGCAPFVCFGCTAAGLESPSPLKVGPTQNKDVLPPPIIGRSKDSKNSDGCVVVDDDDSKRNVVNLKSSLKKAAKNAAIASTDGNGGGGENKDHQTLCEKNDDFASQMERRKVQWTDTSGGELFEIREFEMSEDGLDNEFGHGNEKTCSCTIM